MPELILSDITVMGPGYCVIGLEQLASGAFRSIRPLPPWGHAWREPFRFKRGDRARFTRTPSQALPPHVEDQQCAGMGLELVQGSLNEGELIGSLREAEIAADLEQLFGCELRASTRGGRAVWVSPTDARRSVCGCEYQNIWFRLYAEHDDFTLRARLSLGANERLESIPIVDRDWRQFVARLVENRGGLSQVAEAERLLNRAIRRRLLASLQRLIRIGLARPRDDDQCWLMLDSLFPQPAESWLEVL